MSFRWKNVFSDDIRLYNDRMLQTFPLKLFPLDKHLKKLPPSVATVSSDPSAPEISTHPVTSNLFNSLTKQSALYLHSIFPHHASLPLPQIWLKV